MVGRDGRTDEEAVLLLLLFGELGVRELLVLGRPRAVALEPLVPEDGFGVSSADFGAYWFAPASTFTKAKDAARDEAARRGFSGVITVAP